MPKQDNDLKSCFGGGYVGKRVLVTGHTGFKGSWLCEWLLQLGADVTGLALPPSAQLSVFHQLNLQQRLHHVIGDIRDASLVKQVVKTAEPDFIFHLAAQPLVRYSYEYPVETYATNVMGTVHVLDAIRALRHPCAAVMITTDKCYENKEWIYGYREEDPMGGHDPYSSSKGAAELAIASYRHSYFSQDGFAARVASARAGNVIGGGDWALDRIVPDCIRSLKLNQPIPVRNKRSTRPWQHVLEPLSGYLWLAACLSDPRQAPHAPELPDSQLAILCSQLAGPYNFGPNLASNRSVAELVQEILKHWPGKWDDKSDPEAVHEATRLNLVTDKAFHLLQWSPVWNFEETVAETMQWYLAGHSKPGGLDAITCAQIGRYTQVARSQGIAWAKR
jgi:CDP-glucose 4,6-dehydratase